MKTIKKLLMPILLLLLALTSCKTATNSERTVRVYADGILLKQEEVKLTDTSWQDLGDVNAPNKKGYSFLGWYWMYEGKFQEFDASKVTNDMTDIFIYANYTNELTVTYVTNTNTTIPTEVLFYNDLANKPADPEKVDYTFVGWYKDSLFTELFDFNTKVQENLTLYAKFVLTDEEYNVTFMVDGDIYRDIVTQDKKVELPPNPNASEGYRFVGWFYDAEFTKPFNGIDLISEDTVLYAKFEEYIPTYGKLSQPTISYNDGMITLASEGAVGYIYTLEYKDSFGNWSARYENQTTSSNQIDLNNNSKGEYRITVIAKGDGVYTVNSDAKTYPFNHLYLSKTSGFFFDYENMTLSFDNISHDDQYVVTYEGKEYDLGTSTIFTLPDKTIGYGVLSFTVSAYDKSGNYEHSATTYSFTYYRLEVPEFKLVDNKLVFNQRNVTYIVDDKVVKTETVEDGEILYPYNYSNRYDNSTLTIVTGWYLDKNLTTIYDYSKQRLTDDLVLYGKTTNVTDYSNDSSTTGFMTYNTNYSGTDNSHTGNRTNYLQVLETGQYYLNITPNNVSYNSTSNKYSVYNVTDRKYLISEISFNPKTSTISNRLLQLEAGKLYRLEFSTYHYNTYNISYTKIGSKFELLHDQYVINVNGKTEYFNYNKDTKYAYQLPKDSGTLTKLKISIKAVKKDCSFLESFPVNISLILDEDGNWKYDSLKINITDASNNKYQFTYNSQDGFIETVKKYGFNLTKITYNDIDYTYSNGDFVDSNYKSFSEVLNLLNVSEVEVEGTYKTYLNGITVSTNGKCDEGSNLYILQDGKYTKVEELSSRFSFQTGTDLDHNRLDTNINMLDLFHYIYEYEEDTLFIQVDGVMKKVQPQTTYPYQIQIISNGVTYEELECNLTKTITLADVFETFNELYEEQGFDISKISRMNIILNYEVVE